MPEKHSISSRNKTPWKSFVSSSTLHGLHFVFERENTKFRRTFWCLLIIGQIIWLAFQTNIQLKKYFSYRVQTKVTLEYERSLLFPSVTLCNFNPFKRSKVEAKYEKLLGFVSTHHGKKSVIKRNETLWSQFTNIELNMTREYLTSGFSLEELMFKCQWSGRPCNVKNFTSTLTSFGLCYTFNSGGYFIIYHK